jgi:hypothetical protein
MKLLVMKAEAEQDIAGRDYETDFSHRLCRGGGRRRRMVCGDAVGGGSKPAAESGGRKIRYYQSPMHP